MKTVKQHVSTIRAAATALGFSCPDEAADLIDVADFLEQLEQTAPLPAAPSTTKAAENTGPSNKLARVPTKLLNWRDVFDDFDDTEKQRALEELETEHGYTFGENAGTLVSVWDTLKVYLKLHGCNHTVLKAIADADFVVYWA